jgi:oligoendopeptidase F
MIKLKFFSILVFTCLVILFQSQYTNAIQTVVKDAHLGHILKSRLYYCNNIRQEYASSPYDKREIMLKARDEAIQQAHKVKINCATTLFGYSNHYQEISNLLSDVSKCAHSISDHTLSYEDSTSLEAKSQFLISQIENDRLNFEKKSNIISKKIKNDENEKEIITSIDNVRDLYHKFFSANGAIYSNE